MPRTIIDIPTAQLRDLDARCESLGISRAEAVRRAIQALLRETKVIGGFGLWSVGPADPAQRAGASNGDGT